MYENSQVTTFYTTGKKYISIILDDEYMYALCYGNNRESYKVIKLSIEEPEANPIKEIDLNNESVVLLEKKTDGIQVITEQKIDFDVNYLYFYMLTSHKYNFNLEEDTTAARNAISSSKKSSYYNKDVKVELAPKSLKKI